MRFSLATGALMLLLGGATAFASAAPTVAIHPTTVAASADVDAAPSTSGASVVAPHASHPLKNFASRIFARTNRLASGLTRSALRFLGTPYVFGGTSAYGFDCSGYVQHVFAIMGVRLPRTADAQYYVGHRPTGGLKKGDLVFFQTYEPGPSHVGIYIGHNRFVHASSSHGVMVSSLSDSYWGPKFIGAKRYLASR